MNLFDLPALRTAPEERPFALGLAWMSLVAALCWMVLLIGALHGASDPSAAAAAASATPVTTAPPAPYSVGQLILVFALWAGMSTAVMLPLAIRATELFAHAAARDGAPWPQLRTALFVVGHLQPCAAFATLAALMQWTLHDAGMLDDSMAVRYPAALGLALVAAGVYQWLPSTHACLEHCRVPLPGILGAWRDGLWDALCRGIDHARTCLGCCWLLMLLPLTAGPLDPVAIAAIVVLVPAQIRLAGGHWIASLGGLAMLAWGTRLLFP